MKTFRTVTFALASVVILVILIVALRVFNLENEKAYYYSVMGEDEARSEFFIEYIADMAKDPTIFNYITLPCFNNLEGDSADCLGRMIKSLTLYDRIIFSIAGSKLLRNLSWYIFPALIILLVIAEVKGGKVEHVEKDK